MVKTSLSYIRYKKNKVMIKFKLFVIWVLSLSMGMLLSCSKDASDDLDEESGSEDIYLAGIISGAFRGGGQPRVGNSIAAYWINNEEIRLTDGAQAGHAAQILVSENDDVYVLGGVESSYSPGASKGNMIVWRNGKAIKTLMQDDYDYSAGRVYPNIMALHGQDWYVAYGSKNNGQGYLHARYWKNGQEMTLKSYDGLRHHYATSIGVSEKGDVFIAGVMDGYFQDRRIPIYWKNGEPFPLEVPGGVTQQTNFQVCAIHVKGDDVYIAGEDHTSFPYNGVYWKNGKIMVLPSDVLRVTSLSVSQNAIYIAGGGKYKTSSKSSYFRDGVDLDPGWTLNISTSPYIFIFGNPDVYLTSDNAYEYIKNGKPVTVDAQPRYSDRDVFIRSIYVKSYE